MFRQMLRFTILSIVVTNKKAIDQFFEQNKQEPQIRRMPLFWLQWHMAKCAANEFPDAEKFLEQGYLEAASYETRTKRKFDRRQLDDRRIKFLMLRAGKTSRTADGLFNEFNESIALAEKILRQDEPKHYPFESLVDIVLTFSATCHKLDAKHKKLIHKRLDQLIIYARKRVGVIPDGYQRDKAQSALNNAVL